MRYRPLIISTMFLIFLCDYTVCLSQSPEPESDSQNNTSHKRKHPEDLTLEGEPSSKHTKTNHSDNIPGKSPRKVPFSITQRLQLQVQFSITGSLHGVKSIEITTSNGLQFRTPDYGGPLKSRLRGFKTNELISLGILPIYTNSTPLKIYISIIPDQHTLSFCDYYKPHKCWYGVEEQLVGTLTTNDLVRGENPPFSSLTVEANPEKLALLLAD